MRDERRCRSDATGRATARPYVERARRRAHRRRRRRDAARAGRAARARRDRRRARRARRLAARDRSARPPPRSARPPASRCSPIRCRARAAARPRSPTTTRCCATTAFAAAHAPDLVIRVGDLPTSKPLRDWLAGLARRAPGRARPRGRLAGPGVACSTTRCALDPATALSELAQAHAAARRAATGWRSWRSADARAAEAILGGARRAALSEPAVAAELGVLLPGEATLFVASSMPVRDIETFWPVRPDPPARPLQPRRERHRRHASRAPSARPPPGAGPVVLLIGDVALAHDIGGLLAARRLGLELTIVLLDNGGGGIFDFLPVARAAMAPRARTTSGTERTTDIYTRHIATPTASTSPTPPRSTGSRTSASATSPRFRAALERALARAERSSIIEVRTDRARERRAAPRACGTRCRRWRSAAAEQRAAAPPA